MGSSECEEGKIFLISQLWSVFAGLPRAKEAMDRAEEILETPIGIRLAYPAYSHQYPYIGSMAEKEPGVQDNGGIYLHPSAWKLAVDSLLRRPDRVEEGIKKMLPANKEYGGEKCGEPYAMYNSYFAPETGYRAGTPGQSWRTASSSWMLKSVVEYVFGLHAEIDGLRICPCLPLSWKESSIKKIFRGCIYDITFKCDGSGSDVVGIKVNGESVSYKDNIIPAESGKTLKIEVKLSHLSWPHLSWKKGVPPTFLIRKVGKRISHRTTTSLWRKLLRFQRISLKNSTSLWWSFWSSKKLFSKSFLCQGLGRKPRLIMHTKSTALPCFFFFCHHMLELPWGDLALRGFPLKSPLKIRKNFSVTQFIFM